MSYFEFKERILKIYKYTAFIVNVSYESLVFLPFPVTGFMFLPRWKVHVKKKTFHHAFLSLVAFTRRSFQLFVDDDFAERNRDVTRLGRDHIIWNRFDTRRVNDSVNDPRIERPIVRCITRVHKKDTWRTCTHRKRGAHSAAFILQFLWGANYCAKKERTSFNVHLRRSRLIELVYPRHRVPSRDSTWDARNDVIIRSRTVCVISNAEIRSCEMRF